MRDESAALTAARAAVAADAAFGADMYQVLAEDAADTVFSPASVASALRMALCGARGETAAELTRALHLDGSDSQQDVAVSGLRLVSAWPDGRPGRVPGNGSATFRAPNTVWVQSGLPLRAEYTAQLRQAAATLADADFAAAPEAARTLINRVIAEQTGGKITGLLPPGAVSRMARLVLASAVYLKAAWTQPFPEGATADAPFYPDGQDHTGPDRADDAPHRAAGLPSRRRVPGQCYSPTVTSAWPWRVVLPDGPLPALRPKVAGAGLGGLLAGTARHQVTLSLPRFRLEAAFDLIPALRRLGVTEAFGDKADFSGITDAEPLQIGAVVHKAYIDVDEHGTEAAAATAIVIRAMAAFRAPPPVTMVVDRPFLFAIIDTATSLPLFLGQVSHPRAS